MIIELLFNLIFGIIDIFLSLLPEINFEFEMPDTSTFQQWLGLADYFFPVGTLIAAIGVLIAFQNINFILKIANFVYKKIPFI